MTRSAVVMACNTGHAPYAFCLAEQIAQLHPRRNFDICVFSDEQLVTPISLQDVGIRLVTWPSSNPFHNAPNLSRHGLATWLRLLVPAMLASQYERVLYLDSDILLLRPGIDVLLDLDLKGQVLGAVRDHQQWRRPLRQVLEYEKHELTPAPYFNAGMLLIDVNRFNEESVLEQCLSLMKRRPDTLLRHDQSALNLVLRNRWVELSPIWNWQFAAVSRFHMLAAEPRLVHFIGRRKPWDDVEATTPTSYRKLYRTFQERHYTSRPEICTADPNVMGWPERPVWSFLKHALNARRMHAYLSRFSEPYAVLKLNNDCDD